MKFEKAPTELVEFIADKMKNVDCECRLMFGYPSYFINGNMFAGLFGLNLLLRLSESDMAEVTEREPSIKPFEPMPGRTMKGYVSIPKAVYINQKEFDLLLEKSVTYASSLPPKAKKKK